jgi:hypothetical protein
MTMKQFAVTVLLCALVFMSGCTKRVNAMAPPSSYERPNIRIIVKTLIPRGNGEATVLNAPGTAYVSPPWFDVTLLADATFNFPDPKYNQPSGGVKQLELRWGSPTQDFVIASNREVDAQGTVPESLGITSTDGHHNPGSQAIKVHVDKPTDVSAIATDYFGNRWTLTIKMVPGYSPQ